MELIKKIKKLIMEQLWNHLNCSMLKKAWEIASRLVILSRLKISTYKGRIKIVLYFLLSCPASLKNPFLNILDSSD